ncbi:HAMP domain-containing sensor histidine kinase [Bdellovibrionota bacterium FG-1]
MKHSPASFEKEMRRIRLQILSVGIILFLLSCVLRVGLTYKNRQETAHAIGLSVERNLQIGDNREVLLSLERGTQGVFSGVRYQETLPSGQKHILFELGGSKSSFGEWTVRYSVRSNPFFQGTTELLFYFSPFEGIGFLILLVIPLFAMLAWWILRKAASNLSEQIEISTTAQKANARNQLAAQVAHDIRSPLAALDMVLGDLSGIDEDRRVMIRSAVTRIKDIANNLLEKNRNPLQTESKEASSVHLVSAVLDGLVTEKRTQYRSKLGMEISFELTATSYGLFAEVQLVEFKRVISNLINNSVEAMDSDGLVQLHLLATNDEIKITVRDTGKGIPPEILPRLMSRGETHGKKGGSGLGLFHAKQSIESWKGQMILSSEIGKGTQVVITLPRAKSPSWFVSDLSISPGSHLVILDDDESIHQIWQGRADAARLSAHGIELIHLSTPSDLRAWIEQAKTFSTPVQYLLDFELVGFKETGLDLAEKLNISKQSILVTSRYEEPVIRERCQKLHIPLIPKGMAGFVPIKIVEAAKPHQKPDAILIDDDPLVHLTWKVAAKRAGATFAIFDSLGAFLEQAAEFDRNTPVYIDSFLGKDTHGNEIQGELVSQEIFRFGFKTIYLATGLPPQDMKLYPWLSGVRGKEPPMAT